MNTSINISLPASLKEYIKQRVAQEGYSTPSDFIRDLIREDKRRQEQARLERLLLEGLESGSERLTLEEWQALKKAVLEHKQGKYRTSDT